MLLKLIRKDGQTQEFQSAPMHDVLTMPFGRMTELKLYQFQFASLSNSVVAKRVLSRRVNFINILVSSTIHTVIRFKNTMRSVQQKHRLL